MCGGKQKPSVTERTLWKTARLTLQAERTMPQFGKMSPGYLASGKKPWQDYIQGGSLEIQRACRYSYDPDLADTGQQQHGAWQNGRSV